MKKPESRLLTKSEKKLIRKRVFEFWADKKRRNSKREEELK